MRFKRSIVIFITIIFLSAGCTSNPPPKGVEDFPYDLMVNIVDLTNKFEYFSSEFPKIDGAFSYSITYVNRSKMIGSNFSHWTTIYSDSKSPETHIHPGKQDGSMNTGHTLPIRLTNQKTQKIPTS